MDSDHVEDVFAEDNVIRRDIFRTLRDGLLRAPLEGVDRVEEQVHIRLDTLGYVAATVSKLATRGRMREALGRAAELVQAHFTAYSAEDRARRRSCSKTAIPTAGSSSKRPSPTSSPISSRLGSSTCRRSSARHRSRARRRPASAARSIRASTPPAAKTIMRGGCVATGSSPTRARSKVTFTPLSEQDASDVDQYMPQFAREVAAIFSRPAVTRLRSPRRGALDASLRRRPQSLLPSR